MPARLVFVLLLALLGWLQAQLWLGRGSVGKVEAMRVELERVTQANQQARWRNEQLANEVLDLKEGLEIIEEKARMELGMVKPNELLVQIAQGKR
ncbi:MAG: septum formation initiator family protein [Burkholderiaceae bacterium]|nr:septum formation initiator family protein [Burkholderiaceae bacterium]MDP3422451.1 septum formation initiator family protein [Burkholderiaceae bacterium]MDZ4161115.1 septum formation initiator family protein [Burkholderiales bacterium]